MLMSTGTPIFNVRKTWEKIVLAARIIAAIENPNDVCVLSNRQYGQVKLHCIYTQFYPFEVYFLSSSLS